MKALRIALKLLPHALLIIAGMFTTFLIIDTQNKAMEFIDNDISKSVMAVWCAVSAVVAITLIVMQRRSERERAKRQYTSATRSGDPNGREDVKAGEVSDNGKTAHDARPSGEPDYDLLEQALEYALEALRRRHS